MQEYLPLTDGALLNQTTSNYVVDDTKGTELFVTANMYNLQKPLGGTDWTTGVAVTAVANSRRGIVYDLLAYQSGTICSSGSTWHTSDLPYSHTFNDQSDNEGFWLDFPLNNGAQYLWFYGAWYNKLFVTENGYITFDPKATADGGGIYTNPSPPASFPSRADGRADSVVAPYWTALHGGTVKWGSIGWYFHVAWLGSKNSAGSQEYFSIQFRVTAYSNSDAYSEIGFNYCQISNAAGTTPRAGIENQVGRVGTNVPYTIYSNYFATISAGSKLWPRTSTKWDTILSVNVKAHKYYDEGGNHYTNDPTAKVLVGGVDGSTSLYPGGINVFSESTTPDYTDPTKTDYTKAIWTGIEVFIFVAGSIVTGGTLGAALLLAGGLTTVVDVTMALLEIKHDSVVINNADSSNGLDTANVDSQVNSFDIPEGWSDRINLEVYDVMSEPVFYWTLVNPAADSNKYKIHGLEITAELRIRTCGGGSCTDSMVVMSTGAKFSVAPYLVGSAVQYVTWYGRTVPDSHTYTFRPLISGELPSGVPPTDAFGAPNGYHIDSLQGGSSSDTGFSLLGWTKNSRDFSADWQLDANGRILVEGYFRLSGTMPAAKAYLYAISPHYMYSNAHFNDNLKNIVAKVQIPITSGAGWSAKLRVAIDVGATWVQQHNPPTIKLAVGSEDNYAGDYWVGVDWAAVQPIAGGSPLSPVYRLQLQPAGAAGTTDLAPGNYYYVAGATQRVQATNNPGFAWYKWMNNAAWDATNPITVTMDQDRVLVPYFTARLTINNQGGGGVTPATGDFIYGTHQTVTAQASGGYRLGWWDLDGAMSLCSTPTGTCTYDVFMDKAHTLTVNFIDSTKRALLISVNDAAKGSTSPSGPQVVAATGSVTVTATPKSGFRLLYWLKDGSQNTNNPITISMGSADHTLAAQFGVSGGGCVAEGTLVTLPDGTTSAIEQLKAGDQVLGYDPASDAYVVETIQAISSIKIGELLNFNDGLLRTTLEDQPIYVRTPTGDRWVQNPIDIQLGWKLFNPLTKEWTPITSITLEVGKFKVYDFQTDGPRTYIANLVLVLDKPIPR